MVCLFVYLFSGGKTNKHVLESWKVTTNHKEEVSQVNDFSGFLCWGEDLGSLKLFLRYALQFSRTNI